MVTYGVIFHPSFPLEEMVSYAQRAEAAGFDEFWLWEDCFWAGAYTSAALVLAQTEQIKVGIGLSPVSVRNPLFYAMEITTLARLYPQRFIPAFGHGVGFWMEQIGAATPSSISAIEETVLAVRALLEGQEVTMQGSYVHLDKVKMLVTPQEVPPLLIGGMREKTIQLAGRVGDGTILAEIVSPAYVRWAKAHLEAGAAQGGRTQPQMVVYQHCKISSDGVSARNALRDIVAQRIDWAFPHLQAYGVMEEATRLWHLKDPIEIARQIPEVWLDDLCASGTAEQAAASLQRLADAGADSIILQPLDGDPSCFETYINELMPLLR